MRGRLKLIKFLKYSVIFGILAGAILFVAYNHNLYVWEEQPPGSMWIVNGRLFEGTNLLPIENPGILIKNGNIACLGNICEIPANAVQIDATGKSIVPGLIELHGHFFGGKADYSRRSLPAMIWNSIRLQPDVRRKLIESGITSYRSVGDPNSGIYELKNSLDMQEVASPHMFIAAPIFTAPGGHPAQSKRIPKWMIDEMTVQSDDPEYVKTKIAALVEQGVDGIKVIYQGHTNEHGEVILLRISIETLQAITAEARKFGLWVAVHTGSPEETNEAIKAGITTIEHGVRHGNIISSETLQLIVEHNIVYVPTLGREPKGHLNIHSLHQAGIQFGVGTDTQGNMIVGDSYHNELSRMVEAGIPDAEVLLAATRNGAVALREIDQMGTIQVGKFADLLLVNGHPWLNIRDLKNIEMVVLSGRIALDKRELASK
jgi:imidazolonepropionase-like amidohydrolase